LKVRLTDLENRVAAFPDADAAAGAFAAIKENLSALETRINLLNPDRLYLNFDDVTSWQFSLNAEKEAFEKILEPITSAIGDLEQAQRFWDDEQRRWLELQGALPPRITIDSVEAAIDAASQTIDSARQIITENVNRLLTAQIDAITIQSRIHTLSAIDDKFIDRAPLKYLRQAIPSLFSSAYYEPFNRQLLVAIASRYPQGILAGQRLSCSREMGDHGPASIHVAHHRCDPAQPSTSWKRMWVSACSHGGRSPRVPSSAFSFSLGRSMRAHQPGRL
jgi:hypothetical protein